MLESTVYARLPRGGLGNKLLVWARALIFARQHGLPLYVSGWADIKIGPYLRGERVKRQYRGYFSDSSVPSLKQRIFFSTLYDVHHQSDLNIDQSLGFDKNGQLYLFDTVPSWHDYFYELRGHEELVRASFYKMLDIRYREQLREFNRPIIAVHIRRSDFRELAPGESLGENCNVRTPISYYTNAILALRKIAGWNLPVTVFTDGRAEEVKEVLALPTVAIAAPNHDILDLLLMSKAECLVTSMGSTFSYWAAYISQAPVITHPAHPLAIRANSKISQCYEGPLGLDGNWSPVLVRNIRNIAGHQT